ncbi:MAG: archease [Haloferacaceae archaeon]
MSYTLREHTADVAVEATGPTLGETFAAVAEGLTEAMCEERPSVGERFSIEERAENGEALLFDYLDRLIYERDVRGVLPVEHECEVTVEGEWVAVASARGVPLSHVAARDVKAVTYSEMALEERDDGWYAYVVFDV